jgi:hypothetical protein
MNNERWRDEMGEVPLSEDIILAAQTYFAQRKEWLSERMDSVQ